MNSITTLKRLFIYYRKLVHWILAHYRFAHPSTGTCGRACGHVDKPLLGAMFFTILMGMTWSTSLLSSWMLVRWNSEKCWPLILILNSPLVSFHTRNSPGVGARNNELLVVWHWLIAHLKPILTAFTFQQHFRREFQNKLSEICRCIFLHSWLTIAVGPRLTRHIRAMVSKAYALS